MLAQWPFLESADQIWFTGLRMTRGLKVLFGCLHVPCALQQRARTIHRYSVAPLNVSAACRRIGVFPLWIGILSGISLLGSAYIAVSPCRPPAPGPRPDTPIHRYTAPASNGASPHRYTDTPLHVSARSAYQRIGVCSFRIQYFPSAPWALGRAP